MPPPNPLGVPEEAFFKYLFPPEMEQPDSTCRFDCFGYYGPCDDNGKLRGGTENNHIIQNHEIKEMGVNLNREKLFELYGKPRETVEIVVHELEAVENFTEATDFLSIYHSANPVIRSGPRCAISL